MTSPQSQSAGDKVSARTASIDLLRIAVLALVVVRHTLPDTWAGRTPVLGWSVPFFFVITGWLWSRGKRSTLGEAQHRWRSLGRPYIAWGTLILAAVVLDLLLNDRLTVDALKYPIYGGYFAQRPFTTFWFISVLFFVAVFFRAMESSMVVATVLAVAGLGVGFAFGPELARTPLAVGATLPCLSLVLFGYGLRRIAARRGAIPIAMGALVAGVFGALVTSAINIKPGDYGTPVLSLLACCAIIGSLLVLSQAIRVPAPVGRAAATLTSVGVCVLLTHPVVLWLLDTPSEGAPLWHFAAALILPWAAGLAIARTRLSPWLLGH